MTRVNPEGPSSFIFYAENAAASNIELEIVNLGANTISFNATAPFTGFIRLAALSTNDPAPTVNTNWEQQTYFMAPDTNNPQTATCPVEDPNCGNNVLSASWWRIILVDAISPTGMNLYLLYPNTWTNLATMLSKKQIGANWQLGGDPIRFPDTGTMSILLPLLCLQDSATAETYYQDFLSQTNVNAPPYNFAGDFSTNFFTLRFDMYMAQNIASDINTFQNGNPMPQYTLTAPVNNSAVYDNYRRYIPVSATIATTANTVAWTYTLSDQVPPGDGQNKPLICFPLWKHLQGSTPGVVNTTPGAGEPLQNFIYNDTIKGTFYAAEATNGTITFLEQKIPSWFTSNNLFIPSQLTFTSTQLQDLDNILTSILPQQTLPRLPYIPELQIDPAYNGGKTAFMLAKTALYMAYFLTQNGQASQIDQVTRPYIENAKSILTAYLVGRIPGKNFFVADRTGAGICVNGAGGVGDYVDGPNMQQLIDSGVDFGNYDYNDHHFFAGYFIMTAAMITDWELKYAPQDSHWVDVPVMGADYNQYKMRDFVDFLWRDAHNPFSNDPDLPYDRQGYQWEGHSIANGLQYEPFALGRNQESIAEDFNCWLGMHAYSEVLLKTSLTGQEQARYQTIRDFSLMNLKLTASSGSVLWYKNPTYWKRALAGTSIDGAIYPGQFSMTTVTNGQVNDQSAQNQTFF
ncbi:glycosyl hydrolase [Simkania sp.]|uniref:glycosyl hydrolase n=1 Tax=Simkania sp. TaxID=34094 RepID=UPI003B5225D9